MLSMNKEQRGRRCMPTLVITGYPFSHRKLSLRSCISHTIFKMAIAVCPSTILAKRQTSAKTVLDIVGI